MNEILSSGIIQTGPNTLSGEMYEEAQLDGELSNTKTLEGNLAAAYGTPGIDGGYYIPSVENGELTWKASKPGMPEIESANIKGEPGYTPVKNKDYFDGDDGITPHIGDNGNWFIGETDTGKPSQGYTPVKGKDYTDGYTPVKGKDYTDGYTPQRGTDYWTEADKDEMVSAVIAALPVYDGEVVTL